MAVCGDCDATYTAGNSRGPGWREFAGTLGQSQAGRQAGSGMARSRAKARLNWVSQGQRWGRCRVRRRAERVIRPAREKNRRRRVLVVTTCSPRPVRAVQRARSPSLYRQPGGETARRHVVQPHAVRSRMAFSLGVTAMIGLVQSPIAVGDEAVIAVGGEASRASALTRRTMSRTGAVPGSPWKGCRWSRPHRRRRPSSESASGIASISRSLLCWPHELAADGYQLWV